MAPHTLWLLIGDTTPLARHAAHRGELGLVLGGRGDHPEGDKLVRWRHGAPDIQRRLRVRVVPREAVAEGRGQQLLDDGTHVLTRRERVLDGGVRDLEHRDIALDRLNGILKAFDSNVSKAHAHVRLLRLTDAPGEGLDLRHPDRHVVVRPAALVAPQQLERLLLLELELELGEGRMRHGGPLLLTRRRAVVQLLDPHRLERHARQGLLRRGLRLGHVDEGMRPVLKREQPVAATVHLAHQSVQIGLSHWQPEPREPRAEFTAREQSVARRVEGVEEIVCPCATRREPETM